MRNTQTKWEGAKPLQFFTTLAVGLIVWFLPHPEGITTQAWHLLAIFLATICGLILRPMPMGAVALMSIVAVVTTGTLTLQESLTGFSNDQIWLLVIACFLARAFIKTGLGRRIAYIFLTLFGRSPLGLAYGFIASDFVLAPAIPSSTARGGGILMPIVRSLSETLGSKPEEKTERRIGGFLTLVTFQATIINTATFLTASAANPIIIKLAAAESIDISWGLWFQAAIVPSLVSLSLLPLLIFFLYPPELRDTSDAAAHAKEKLAEMGKVSNHEKFMAITFFALLIMWIFGGKIGLHATTAALIGLVALLVSGVLTWKDIIAEEVAWDSLVWFSVIVTLATQLNTLGVISWVSNAIVVHLINFPWHFAMLALTLIYFYLHYAFASVTAHVSSLYGPFLAVALGVGTPPLLAALVLAFFSSLSGGLTHYGNGQAPIFFSMRYVPIKTWWGIGSIVSVMIILVWACVGSLWWKWLGLW